MFSGDGMHPHKYKWPVKSGKGDKKSNGNFFVLFHKLTINLEHKLINYVQMPLFIACMECYCVCLYKLLRTRRKPLLDFKSVSSKICWINKIITTLALKFFSIWEIDSPFIACTEFYFIQTLGTGIKTVTELIKC